jgi:hypothetical protein
MTTFSTAHISLTAAVTGLIALPLTYWLLRPRSWIEAGAVALVAAASVFLFRKSANMGQLNDDGLSPFSANDWLAPVLTYVSLGIYAAIRPPADPVRFGRLRALLTAVSFVVNVVTI